MRSRSRSNRRIESALIICVVVVVCSLSSHITIHLLKVKTTYSGFRLYGGDAQKRLAILHGSSLAYGGVDWAKVAERVGCRIETWATPGSSPAEWEVQDRRRSREVLQAFIVVSTYDLNECSLCDFRANIVPLGQSIADLWQTRSDWPFCKRLLSEYAVMSIRKLFPTVGRSDGVMTGIRDHLHNFFRGRRGGDSGESVRFGAGGVPEIRERLSEWSVARLQRRLVLMRSALQGRHTFNGPKKMALTRLLQRAASQGPVTLVAVPVSPIYQEEFLSAEVKANFEAALSELQRSCPQANVIRLDHIPALQDNALFSDLVHLNVYGQRIATALFLKQLHTTQP